MLHFSLSDCKGDGHMIPHIDCSLREASARTEGDSLIVTTGAVSRVWQWTDTGFATSAITDIGVGRSWEGKATGCDWQLPDASEASDAEIRRISARVHDDDGFTSEHVCVTADIAYPNAGLLLRMTVWAFPKGSGIRSQLSAMFRDATTTAPKANHQGPARQPRVDRLPAGDKPLRRRFFGYYNDTQNRNDTHLDILKEEVNTHRLLGAEFCDWASAACLEDNVGGLALVKESHKCVNQRGYESGGFICDQHEGLSATGWGLKLADLSADKFTPCWATWCIVWNGGALSREIAFKTFDKLRYPIDTKRDVYIQANTWGSTTNGQDARRAACKESVLQELDTCHELGIDALQIDDGWQVPPGHDTWIPEANGWNPHPEAYPDGWNTVRARAAELGIRLGLWAAAQPVGLDELKRSFTDGGFLQYKLDFANLKSRAAIDELMAKVREFISWTGHKIRVNWDVTENEARYGYFFAREYGCIYLENRKPVRPLPVIYRPHTVLRDLWQISKYLNLHRFQCSIQNVDRVDQTLSDANLHSHAYATAIALMGIPLFFQETKYYSAEAKAEIKPLLSAYKKHREAIYRGIVHPIGNKPNNAEWTGFQCHLPEEQSGYLMIFRERCNQNADQSIELGWLHPGSIDLMDVTTERKWQQSISQDNSLSLSIENAPGFLFLRYRIQA